MLERLESYRHSKIISRFFIVLLLLTTGCASQRPVALANSYSISEFKKLSRHYRKTVFTREGDRIHASRLSFYPDSVDVVGESASHPYSKELVFSDIKKINLIPKMNPGFLGLLTGLAVGGLADGAILFHSDTYFVYLTPFIPPATGLLGFLIGSGFNHTKIYKGAYRIIPDDGTYRLRRVKPKSLPQKHANPILDEE